MAEMIERGNKKVKLSTRVDLTPMVDLGFLLITFFIFTTALTKPTGLKFFLPKSVPDNQRIEAALSGALTLLLAADRKIFYYEGDDPRQMHQTQVNGIRQIIMDKKIRTTPEKLIVIMKPGRDSNFQSLVQVMDEMSINNVKHYALVDIDPVESSLMQNAH